MQSKNKTLTTGLFFFFIGGITLLVERLTNWGVSRLIGKLYCGERYLQAAGQVGDGTCGFNMDMVVGLVCFLLCVTGLLLLVIGLVQKSLWKKKI